MRQRNRLSAVSAYLQAKGLDGELMQQILDFFSSNEHSENIPMSKILPSLNLGLQHEVACFITGDCLQQSPLFRACSGPMLDNLQLLLRDVEFLDGEFVYQQGDVAYDMFIVIRGSVSVIVTDEMGHKNVETELGIGASLGDFEFYFQMPHATSCRALALGARCLRLGRDSLRSILKMHPEDERTISSNSALLVASAKQRFRTRSESHSIYSHSSLGNHASRAKAILRVNRSSSNKAGSKISASTRRSGSKSAKAHSDSSLDINTLSFDSGSDASFNELMDSEMTQAVFLLSIRQQRELLFAHFTYVAQGELHKVQQGLREGIALSAADAHGRTALHVAASSGHRDVVAFLLEAKAQTRIVDSHKNTPLADAVRSKHDTVAQLLREHDPELELELHEDGGNAGQLINAAYHCDLEQVIDVYY